MKKTVVILGSTGEIGKSALAVIGDYPDQFEVVGLACRRGMGIWEQQVATYPNAKQVVTDRDGDEAMVGMIADLHPQLIVVGVVGTAGIGVTLAGLSVGATVALATKEVLVVAGEIMVDALKTSQGQIIPVDSEHAAIFMALQGGRKDQIHKLYLTMGKGKLASLSQDELRQVTPSEILKRKVWSMGPKIGIDSATGINKAFEVIEAHWLFNVNSDQVEVVVHPEYICHSAIEWVDGSILAELGTPDMYRYLHYALFYPDRHQVEHDKVNMNLIGKSLSFESPNLTLFPATAFGHRVLKLGLGAGAWLHGADRAAVESFVAGKINFHQISQLIEDQLGSFQTPTPTPTLLRLLQLEEDSYQQVTKKVESL